MCENHVDIFDKYRHEISKINNTLIDLERGKVYEIDRVPGVPKCSTIAERLRNDISDLLTKINNNEEGFLEVVSKKINSLKYTE